MAVRDIARNILDPNRNTAELLGFREAITKPIPYKIYLFLIKAIRDSDRKFGDLLLYRLFQGIELDFERTYTDVRSIFNNWNYEKCPAALLPYLKNLVGFTDETAIEALTNDISEINLRKLIKVAVSVWKLKGTDAAYENVIRTFNGKNVTINGYHYFKVLFEEGILGEDLDFQDPWLLSSGDVSEPDEYTSDIKIMSSRMTGVEQDIISNFLTILRPTSERLNVIYVDFLDQFYNDDLVDFVSGTATVDTDTLELIHSADDTVTLALDNNSAGWTNAWMMWKAKINSQVASDPDNKIQLIYYYTDENNYMYLELNAGAGTGIGSASLRCLINGVLEVHDTINDIPMDIDTYYCWRITTTFFYDPETSFTKMMQYKIFQDRNLLITHDEIITTSTLVDGNFGVKSFKAHATIKELELYQWEPNIDYIYPALKILPRVEDIDQSDSITFAGIGGSQPYTFSLFQNSSGGIIDSVTGEYTSGTSGGSVTVKDIIKITDKHNKEADASITVNVPSP